MAEKKIINLATEFSEDLQSEIVDEVILNTEIDLESRSDWEAKRNDWFRLSQCIPEDRVVDFEGSSNVCLPMLASAALQFQGRAYQSRFEPPYPERVKVEPVAGNDVIRAIKVEKFLNWQLIAEMVEYESEWDRLLMELPIMGTGFTKTFWCTAEKRPRVEYVPALDVILPYATPSLERARRVTQRLHQHLDEIRAKAHEGFYVDLSENFGHTDENADNESLTAISSREIHGESKVKSSEGLNVVYESHVLKQLPGDDKPMPYIFWVDKANRTLLRATTRHYSIGSASTDVQHFTDYHFIPNPEGFYSFGFGHYIEPLNKIANTLFNQFIDAGRLTNAPMIFYGRGAGIKKRNMRIRPGAAEQVNDVNQLLITKFPGLDQSLPLLLQSIDKFTQDITANTEELRGRAQKGVREPTVKGQFARIEQGLTTLSVLLKRVNRQIRTEMRTIFTLNSLFQSEERQFRVLGSTDIVPFEDIKRADFDGKFDLIPVMDPSFASPGQQRQEAGELMQIFLQHPLIIGDPNTGQGRNDRALLAVLRDLVRTYNKPHILRELPDLPEPSFPPEIENAMFMQGDHVEPKQGEPHAQHLAVHAEFLTTKAFQDLPEDRKDLARAHMDRTEMIAIIEQRQQQQAQLQDPTQAASLSNIGDLAASGVNNGTLPNGSNS